MSDPFLVLRCPGCAARGFEGRVLAEALPGSTVRRPCGPCKTYVVFTIDPDRRVHAAVAATPARWFKGK
jgi:hypothetical protein